MLCKFVCRVLSSLLVCHVTQYETGLLLELDTVQLFLNLALLKQKINYFLLQRERLLNKHTEQTQDNTTLKSDLRGAPFDDDEEHVTSQYRGHTGAK